MDSNVSDALLEAMFFPPFFGAIEAGVGAGANGDASAQLLARALDAIDATPRAGARTPPRRHRRAGASRRRASA